MIELVVAAFVTGLVAIPHCAVMCGPLAFSGCTRASKATGRDVAGYQLGRVVTYALLGAIVGHLGHRVANASGLPTVQTLVLASLAAMCLWRAYTAWRESRQGEQLVQLSSKPRTLARLFASLLPRRGTALGLATGLLPCGATATGLALAAATARADTGALAMAVFVLASAPGTLLPIAGGRLMTRLARRLPRYAPAAGWLLVAMLLAGRLALTHFSPQPSCHG